MRKIKTFNTRVLAYAGVLVAMNVVLTRFLAIPIGPDLRISVGYTPIILASLWFGPLIGGICGALGDLLGCLVGGYAPNPLIFISNVLVGVLPWLINRFIVRGLPRSTKSADGKGKIWGIGFLKTLVIVFITSAICSEGFTTWGLSIMMGVTFWAEFLIRLPQTIGLIIANSILVFLLYESPITSLVKGSRK